MTGLDGLNWTEFPRHNRRESSIGRNWPSRSGFVETEGRYCIFIEYSNQSASGWWQPVCRFAWLRTHARRNLVLHMAGCMSRTHAGGLHSSQMSDYMTRTHARRHNSTHMSISMLQLHARRHLVLGRSTSCFYMSGCMYSFHARLHLELLETLSLLDETSFFQNVELLNRRASKNGLLPKHPSDQSKTSSNYGRATYSTHSSLTITSRPEENMTGLDGLNWTEFPRHNRRESSIGRNWPSRYGCVETEGRSCIFIEYSNQSASGWWQPVCRFAWLRTHARRNLVLQMAGCMSRTHAGRHHSSQMSDCMTRTHARRHNSTHMSIIMLQLHARRHLVLGRSTSCFYMSGCMYSFHARLHLELLETFSLLDG
ncbi:hypothetical protein F2Q69_00058885 [Brassica cretica]|uniref:Uncharacterized protein n=1 Tax=Brassica cretica TaxID=69181 RepID=A0A8S9RKU4_BRACR|nr:hypothetical protein F2Q69_00058885 [Brassica cretica]